MQAAFVLANTFNIPLHFLPTLLSSNASTATLQLQSQFQNCSFIARPSTAHLAHSAFKTSVLLHPSRKRQKTIPTPTTMHAAASSPTPSTEKVTIHVEVHQRPSSGVPHNEIKRAVMEVLEESSHFVQGPVSFERHHRELAKHIVSIQICELPPPTTTSSTTSSTSTTSSSTAAATATPSLDRMEVDDNLSPFTVTNVPFWQAIPCIHVYKLDGDGPSQEYTGGGESNDEDGISSLEQWQLPCKEFDGLWENLVYDFTIKAQLLSYCQTAMIFADSRVNNNVITWNRVRYFLLPAVLFFYTLYSCIFFSNFSTFFFPFNFCTGGALARPTGYW